jgi:hypothetical protein
LGGAKWSLGRAAFIPHISLYHIPVRDNQWRSFMEELRRIAEDAPTGELKTTGFDMPVLTLSKPKWLDDLHRRIVLGTVPYFDRECGAERTWRLNFFSGRRRELAERYLDRYGTPMFGMNFRPHITLSSFEDGAPEFNPEVEVLTFTPDRLTVCELGQSHSCQRVIEEVPLGGRFPDKK